MHSFQLLGVAFGSMLAVVGLFAVMRRAMRSRGAPRLLANAMSAFFVAIALTLAFACSMVVATFALLPWVPNPFYAFIVALVLHGVAWTVLRLVIPIGDDASA